MCSLFIWVKLGYVMSLNCVVFNNVSKKDVFDTEQWPIIQTLKNRLVEVWPSNTNTPYASLGETHMNSGKEHQDRYRYNCKEITRTKRGLLNMIIVKFSSQVIGAAQLTVYVYSVFGILDISS